MELIVVCVLAVPVIALFFWLADPGTSHFTPSPPHTAERYQQDTGCALTVVIAAVVIFIVFGGAISAALFGS